MPCVLAIDPYPTSPGALHELLSEHVDGELTIVDSIDAALDAIERRVPEVIAISALMPPADEARLTACLRALPKTAFVQILVAPPGGSADRLGFTDRLNSCLDHVWDMRMDLAAPSGHDASDRRLAARAANVHGVRMIVGGLAVSVVDLSVTGAQVLSPTLLVPGHLVQVVLGNEHETICCGAEIVWAFEQLQSTGVTRFRTGVDFRDADRRFLGKLCPPEPRAKRMLLDAPDAFGRVLFG